METASWELVFSSPKWLTQLLPLKKFESLNLKRGRETLRRKGKGSGKSLEQIGNARYEGRNSPFLFPPSPLPHPPCSPFQGFIAMYSALPSIFLTFHILFPICIPSHPLWTYPHCNPVIQVLSVMAAHSYPQTMHIGVAIGTQFGTFSSSPQKGLEVHILIQE